jgi:prepilin-type N-terminal cleavage/methylation domain-containing protein
MTGRPVAQTSVCGADTPVRASGCLDTSVQAAGVGACATRPPHILESPRHGRRGVTLIELMIAVLLLSLLSVALLIAMHVGLNSIDKADAKLIANRRSAGVQRILESQIAGFMPALADCATEGASPSRAPFFAGDSQSMRFVSTYSLQEASRGYPRVLEFAVIPGDQGKGVRLIVNESPYTGPQSLGCIGFAPAQELEGAMAPIFRPIEPGPSSFVLADRLAYCRFIYQERIPAPDYGRWFPYWRQPLWPAAVKVDLAPLEADPTRVPLVSLVSPIYVTRLPYGTYQDNTRDLKTE